MRARHAIPAALILGSLSGCVRPTYLSPVTVTVGYGENQTATTADTTDAGTRLPDLPDLPDIKDPHDDDGQE